MQIVSLNPAFTDIICALHNGVKLTGVTHLCTPSGKECRPVVVTSEKKPATGDLSQEKLLAGLSQLPIDISALEKARPSVIVTTVLADNPEDFITWAEGYLYNVWSRRVRIVSLDIVTLDGLFAAYGTLGALLGSAALGRDRAQRMKSQLLDWGRNLYDRVRNKKVVVIASMTPLEVAGCWIPDIIKLVSGRPYMPDLRKLTAPTTWEDISAFAPDVISIALRDKKVEESVKVLPSLEALSNWDTLPAVKRGEVVFADGLSLYRTGPSIIEGAGVLVSAMAGLDSGYITKRDEFFRLRYVELHRHRLM